MIACTGNYPFVFAIENKIENPLPESAGNLLRQPDQMMSISILSDCSQCY
jgi:hypothetical protein